MKFHPTKSVLFALGALASCSNAGDWPPQQDRLSEVFDAQRDTLIVIEAEMTADGILRMGPAIYAETERSPIVPELPPGQNEKYMALFGSTQIYLDVTRADGSTSFELLLQNDGPRLYLPRFVHSTTRNRVPTCIPAMQGDACGSCSIRLENDWMLEYDWFPGNPEAEAREC